VDIAGKLTYFTVVFNSDIVQLEQSSFHSKVVVVHLHLTTNNRF